MMILGGWVLLNLCRSARTSVYTILTVGWAGQALREMPHRQMYMLSYWSWLWNRAASLRVPLSNNLTPNPGSG